MIKVGFIGYGNIAERSHSKTLSSIPDKFKMTDVYDFTESRMKKANELYGLNMHSCVEDFLKSDIDLVVVAVPTYAHCEMALKALEAGKNVIVEKPMAMNATQADEMIQMANKKGVMLSVHHNRRWDKDYVTVKNLIQQGAIGNPFVIESRVMEYRKPTNAGVKDFYPLWRLEKKYGGGRLNEWGVHYIDQVMQMIDSEVVSVWADLKNIIWSTEVDTYGKCLIKFKNGITFHMETSWVSMAKLPRWFCLGDKGSLVKETANVEDAIKINSIVNDKIVSSEVEVLKDVTCGYYENIYGVLTGEEELIVKPEQARNVIRVVDAARKSSAEGIEVYLK